MDDEQRQRRHLKEQIARAAAQAEARAAATAEGGIGGVEEGLKRDEGEGVRLSLNLSTNTGPIGEVAKKDEDEAEVKKEEGIMEAGPSTIGPTPTTTTTTTAQPAKFSFSTGLKKPQPGLNVFKQASKAPKRPREVEEDDETTKLTTNLAQKKFLTAAEKLMLEDQERKKRGGGGGSRGMGYMGMGPQRRGR
jgi:DNA/RNA-binding protein KIN17